MKKDIVPEVGMAEQAAGHTAGDSVGFQVDQPHGPVAVAVTAPLGGSVEAAMASMTLGEGVTRPQSGPAISPPDISTQDQGQSHQAGPQVPDDLASFPYNPHFAASVRADDRDNDADLARVNADIDLCAHEGDPNDLCPACDKQGKHWCGKCHHARYCSRECQVADWPLHKRFCAAFAGHAADEKRPSPQHYRALFFPVFSAVPELHWVVHRRSSTSEWFSCLNNDVVEFQHRTGFWELKKHKRINTINLLHDLGGRRIGHRLISTSFALKRASDGSFDPKLLNKGILSLGKPGHIHRAFGPVYFHADGRRLGDEGGSLKTMDITPRDVGHVVRFLESVDCVCVNEPARYPGEVISGLRINDLQSMYNAAIGVRNVFEQVTVPLRPADEYDFPIAMAFFLDLRWYIRPGNPASVARDPSPWRDANLRYIGWVYRLGEELLDDDDTGGQHPTFQALIRFHPFSGSAILLHGSGQPILLPHLGAFNGYLDTICACKGAASIEGFQLFWDRYKRRSGAALADVPSPYEYEKPEVKDRLGRHHREVMINTAAEHIASIWHDIVLRMNRPPPPAPPAEAEVRARNSSDHGPLYRGLFD